MSKEVSKIRGLQIGDLVTHLLYGRSWVGILLEIRLQEKGLSSPREIGLVQMQPGTEYEFFFQKKVSTSNKINDTMGYVSMNWLFKLENS